jgi:hypothetical protein
MTSRAAFSLQRRVFVGERPLLIGMTLDAGRVGTGSESGLFKLKASMRVVAIAALHCSFQDFVMERLGEIRFCLAMATHAELRLTGSQQAQR